MQRKLSRGNLLDEHGKLNQAGYSTSLVKRYSRKDVKASKLKIKEWDYYLFYNSDYAIALTVADNSYMGMLSASVINFKEKKEKTSSIIELLTRGHYKMPESSTKGDVVVQTDKSKFEFLHEKEKRRLKLEFKKFDGDKTLKVDVVLFDEPKDSMVIATPFKENEKAFYYNQKIVGFRAEGVVNYGEEEISFNSDDTVGILDWGRGVWTYKNTWFWGSASGYVDNHKIGFNLGYGFGDSSSATENMAFYDGEAFKLNEIKFEIPIDKKGNYLYLEPWKVTSDNGNLELDFMPILNRHSDTNIIVLRSNQNQVFGRFSGKIKLKEKIVEVKDLIGFAEVVYNKW